MLTGGTAGAHTGLTYRPDANYCNDGPTPDDTFTYTLNGGSTATVSVAVTCTDDLPVAVNDPATKGEDSGATAITVLANDTDVDGGPKTISSATDPANGTVVLTGGTSGAHTGLTYRPDPNYCNDGAAPDDTFTYTLNGGSTATVSVAVTCVDDNPVAVNDTATKGEDSGATAIGVLANDTDIDGGTKLVQSASDPANGTVAITGGGSGLTYTPDPNYCNDGAAPDDTFTYTLNGGSTATVSVAVTCTDDLPVAVNDTTTKAEDSGATAIGVLANDTDPDGGPKTIQSASDPANGTVVITGGGSGLTYAPDTGYCNDGAAPDDTFTYTLNGGSTATVSVAVTCTDDAPTAVDDAAMAHQDSGTVPIDVLANDTDTDGGTKAVQSASDPANGTVVITGGGSGLTYEPDPGYCNDGGPDDTFTYTINGGSTATVSVTVVCVDAPPTAVDDSVTRAEDSGQTAINVLANDTDPDGGLRVISSTTQPANGTVEVDPDGLSLTYEPDPEYCNDGPSPDDTFTYTANGGSTATVSVAVTCLEDDPFAVDDSETVAEDSGATAIDVLANDTDPDGGQKTVQSASDPANGTVAITGGGSGLTYTPDADYCNGGPTPDDTFTYTVNGGSTATVSVAVTCTNDNPVAVNDTATKSEDSGATAIGVLVNDTDVDGGLKSIQSASDPANGTVVVTGGGSGLTYSPDANYCNDGAAPDDTFTYTLNGGSTATVAVAVTCVADDPVAADDSDAVAEDSGAVAIGVLANDTDVDGGPTTIQSASDPANGTVVVTGGGSGLTYTPDANYCNGGPTPDDTFTYTLNGGSTATVSIGVGCVEDNPVSANDTATKGEDSGATAIAVLANDTDVDGGLMTIASASDPANGTTAITGGGSGLTYSPDANYCNDGAAPDDTFTYTLNGGSTATVSVAVTCTDDDPVAVNDSGLASQNSGVVPMDVVANDTDPDGGIKTIQSASDPANGTVAITGGGSSLTYEPDTDYCNDGGPDDTFSYTLNGGSTATVSVTVSCSDISPVAVDDPAATTEDAAPVTVDVLANDTNSDGGLKVISSATDPVNGTVEVAPDGLLLAYTPNPDYCSEGTPGDTFTYTLNGGSTATVSVAVACIDDDPVAVDDSASVAVDSGPTAIDVFANDDDPDGGPISIESNSGPIDGTVVITGGGSGLTYEPDAGYCNDSGPDDTFTYTLNGGSTATVSVAVACAPDPPTPDPPIVKPGEQRLHVHRLVVPKSAPAMIRKGIRALVSCELDCKVMLDVTVRPSTAAKLRLTGLRFAHGSVTTAAGEQRWVIARLTRSAKAGLRNYGGGGRLSVKVRAVEP